jgi:hypothetical protein
MEWFVFCQKKKNISGLGAPHLIDPPKSIVNIGKQPQIGTIVYRLTFRQICQNTKFGFNNDSDTYK